MLIEQIKISTELVKNQRKDMEKIVFGRNNAGVTGYLLFQTDADRIKKQYTCFLYKAVLGRILVEDSLCCIEDAVKFHIKLNSHVKCTSVQSMGITGTPKIAAAMLTFRFAYCSTFTSLLGY